MRYFTKTIVVILVTLASSLVAQEKADTVIVNFGNSSKMVFYINEQGDLKALKSYDLNALVSDMSQKIESDSTNQDDESGDKYLRDSTDVDVVSESIEDDFLENDESEDIDFDDEDRDDYSSHSSRNLVISNKLGTNHFINFDLGINNYLQDGKMPNENSEQYAVRPWGSWYFAINSVYKSHLSSRFSVEWGGGISWYNFKFEDDATRIIPTDTEVTFVQSTDDVSFKKSKLTASFINVNAVPVLELGRNNDVRIGFGGYAGYRLGSHSKYVYKDGSKEKDKDRDDFFLNSWRYGARLQLGIKGTDLFVNYDLNELFAEGKGPKLNAFSFGITF